MAELEEGLQFPEHPAVSCINCGFLAKWDLVPDESSSVSEDERRNGWFGLGSSDMPMQPLCWVGAYPLRHEARELARTKVPAREANLTVISASRADCKRFVRWRPWLEFRDHWENWRADNMHSASMSVAKWSLGVAALSLIASVIVSVYAIATSQPSHVQDVRIVEITVPTPTSSVVP